MTPEDQLILLLAGTADRRRAEAARAQELGEKIAPDRLMARLRALRVLGVVGPRATDVLPAAVRAGFEREVRTWVEARRLRARTHATLSFSLQRALAAAKVDAIALKGPDLAARLYGETAARSSADLDLLVRGRQLREGVDVLAAFGYTDPPLDPRRPWRLELHHEVNHASPGLPPVELHWRIEWYCGPDFSDGLIDRALTDADGTRRLRPVDELAALLMIAARDGFDSLRLMVDVAAWWDRYGTDVPHGGLAEIATRHRRLARPLATSAAFAQQLVGLPVERLLDLAPARSRRSRAALRLADPMATVGGPHGAGAVLVDALLSDAPAVRRWCRYRLVPRPGHIALTYGLEPEQRLRVWSMAAGQPARVVVRSLWPLVAAARQGTARRYSST